MTDLPKITAADLFEVLSMSLVFLGLARDCGTKIDIQFWMDAVSRSKLAIRRHQFPNS